MMAEYIDKQAFLAHMKKTNRYFDVKFDIEDFPTADVALVRHGRWLLDGSCSECLENPLTTHQNYCPNCGAKMDLGHIL